MNSTTHSFVHILNLVLLHKQNEFQLNMSCTRSASRPFEHNSMHCRGLPYSDLSKPTSTGFYVSQTPTIPRWLPLTSSFLTVFYHSSTVNPLPHVWNYLLNVIRDNLFETLHFLSNFTKEWWVCSGRNSHCGHSLTHTEEGAYSHPNPRPNWLPAQTVVEPMEFNLICAARKCSCSQLSSYPGCRLLLHSDCNKSFWT